VKISLIGLAPSSTHPANINSGSCVKQGAVVYPLQNVVADARGVGTSTTAIKNVTKIPASGWYINVHNGPNLAPSDQFLPIVCSNLTLTTVSPTSSLSLQVPLNTAPPASAGETVSGMAQLTLAGSKLAVKLTLSGLEPKSMHAAHIHAGSCESQGAVVYPLKTVVSDALGKANVTTTIANVSSIPSIHAGSCESQGAVVYPLKTVVSDALGKANVTTTIANVSSIPSSGWYVNVHHSTDISTQTGFDPIACGNVMVG